MKKKATLLSFSLLCIQVLFAQTPKFIADSLESYIRKGMKDWQIPGLAIAIVQDGKTIFMKGFGERNLATHEKVDENTLFMIASNSKLFTATSLSQLAYDHKLDLNNKITQYFPDFRLYDPNSTQLVTIKDMLSHHLGTKTFQGDFTFWNGNLSRQQIMQKMRLLQPPGQFRVDYGYCNSCFLTAGEVIPRVTGKPWEVYVYDSIILPLGMQNTHTLTTGMSQRPDVSLPYTNAFSIQLQPLPYDQVDNLGPAGSMISCVKDLSKWLLLQLDSGRYEGRRVLPWEVIKKTREMSTIISSQRSSRLPTHFTGYGLGIFMTDYNGKQVYWHTGGAFGFVTNTCFVPEAKLGIIILTNNDNQNFYEALRYQILDAYLGVPYVNRSQQFLPAYHSERKSVLEAVQQMEARVGKETPSLALDKYTGDYENKLYGLIHISKTGNELLITFKGHRNLTASLQYMSQGEWLMKYSNPAFGIFPLHFEITKEIVTGVTIKANDFVEYDAYAFTKL
ncbi:MAG: serine hydrolase [Bacteroidota bacterium]|nr:serine hydrolase [Bacteroidota bacterium]